MNNKLPLIRNLRVADSINNMIDNGLNSTDIGIFIYDNTGFQYNKDRLTRYIRTYKNGLENGLGIKQKKDIKKPTLESISQPISQLSKENPTHFPTLEKNGKQNKSNIHADPTRRTLEMYKKAIATIEELQESNAKTKDINEAIKTARELGGLIREALNDPNYSNYLKTGEENESTNTPIEINLTLQSPPTEQKNNLIDED